MRTVATYGVFDIFHEGHVNLLRRARELGDRLIVGVTTNHFDEIRGKLNTTDSYEVRRQAVLDSGLADEVIPETYVGQKEDDILSRHIDVMVFGSDWTGHFDYLRDLCEVVYLPRTQGISSSALRNARHPEVRLGIVGTGRIARRFISEAAGIGGMRVVGAYNPGEGRADQFVREMGIGFLPDGKDFLATNDLSELLSNVDAVYVASPHQFHFEQARAALAADRHVLCEKPLAFTRSDAEELFSLANSSGLVLLEAIKTAYCPGFAELVDVARSGVIGQICDVSATFTRLTPRGTRERDDALYGGSFLELGCYGLLPAVKLLGAERVMQMNVQFHTLRDDLGVDVFTRAILSDTEAFATAVSGLGVKAEGQLIIGGTEGYILAPSPWWLTSRFEVHHEDPTDVQTYEIPYLGQGLRYEISNFIHLVRGDDDRHPKLLAKESIAIASIMEQYMNGRLQ